MPTSNEHKAASIRWCKNQMASSDQGVPKLKYSPDVEEVINKLPPSVVSDTKQEVFQNCLREHIKKDPAFESKLLNNVVGDVRPDMVNYLLTSKNTSLFQVLMENRINYSRI